MSVATSLRCMAHASIYRGVIVTPHNGGFPDHNAWETQDGMIEKASAWKKNKISDCIKFLSEKRN